jgi:hypothetical protein
VRLDEPLMIDSGTTAFKLAMKVESATGSSSPSGRVAMQVIHLVQQTVPPHLPTIFRWNRATFLGLATLLMAATVGGVRDQRQGHA